MAPGVEAAGAVIAVGTRTNRWAPGDQVITHAVPVREQGSWSEQLVADDDLLAAKPEDVPWDEAAAFPYPRSRPRQRCVRSPPRQQTACS